MRSLSRMAVIMSSSRPAWLTAGATWQANFGPSHTIWDGQNEHVNLSAAIAAGRATFSRSSSQMALDSAGRYRGFASGAVAETDKAAYFEQAATNQITTSGTFAAYTTTAATITTGIAAPDGDAVPTTGARITESGSTGILRAVSISVTSGQAHTLTWRLKRDDTNATWWRCSISPDASFVSGNRFWIDLANGAAGSLIEIAGGTGYSATGLTVSALADGWYEVVLTITPNVSTIYIGMSTASANSSNTRYNPGGGAGVNASWLLWGQQVELGTVPTTPILTNGSAGTRAASALTLKVRPGTYNVTVTFDNASTQTFNSVAVSESGYSLPVVSLTKPGLTKIVGISA